MKKRRIYLVMMVCLLLIVLGGGRMLYMRFLYRGSRPQSISMPSPEVLLNNIPGSGNTRELLWSTDGKYIAMPGGGGYLLIDVQQRKISKTLTYINPHSFDSCWTSDGRLWLAAGDGWDVYAPPFSQKSHVKIRDLFGVNPDEGNLTYDVETGYCLKRKDDSHLIVWLHGKEQYTLNVKPHSEKRFYLCLDKLVFSPDKSKIAFRVRGDEGMDIEGVQEIWVLELKTGKLEFLCEGQSVFGVGLLGHVQNAAPAWCKDSRTILFGDDEWGIEEIDIVTKERKHLIAPRYGGEELKLSHDNHWLGYFRFHNRKLSSLMCPMAVASRDGEQWSNIQSNYSQYYAGTWAWHPTENTLAWTAEQGVNSSESLYLWKLDKP